MARSSASETKEMAKVLRDVRETISKRRSIQSVAFVNVFWYSGVLLDHSAQTESLRDFPIEIGELGLTTIESRAFPSGETTGEFR